MTHFNNLITMTNVMRHNSRTAVNPDGLPTVNRQSKLTSYRGWCKKLTMILAVLVLSIGQMWADYYAPSTDEVIILNTVYDASKTTAGYSKHSAIAWGGTASTNSKKAGDPNNGGAATSGNVNCYSVKGNGEGKNITVSITGCSKIIVYHENHSSRYVELRSESKSGTLIGKGSNSTYYTEVDLTPATTYTIFLHGTTGSDDQDFNVYAVKLIKGSSCAAANLTAANITSNGDQMVGTGITFSKVGSPASGDTWYWQTSATGTDKTYNATSPYTTATTAGSYTVYLRAFNTDCWGTAIGKTNSVYSCPLDVYNGENVDKGKTTASGWTINSSSSMAKTNGSSNGYSYWYQTSSSSGDYVQFDGSIALAKDDQIKIQWTHTNGSSKTLQLRINGSSSSATLTSGSTASSSNLVEAVYDVPSAITVTSIKLNSSGSQGCIIYQVSIVKAACSPSCGETAQAALTLSSNSGTICGTGSTTFTVSGGSGTGELSVSSSDPSKATASIDGTTVTVTGVAAGSADITVTKACDATYAEKTATYSATVVAVPTANAGEDKTTEPGEGVALAATAAASGCTGVWTIQSGPNTSTAQLSSTSSATATFTPTVAGTYTLRWTVTNTSTTCSAYDEMKVTAAICSISECGNATLTYPLNVGTSLVNTAANLVNTPSNGGSAALTVPAASAAVTLSTITISAKDGDKNNNGKAAATTSACYPTAPTMSSKIGMFNGSSYSSSNYLQFAFTVNSGYTFTPCDIQFTVQPVSSAGNFRWEVTDGTNIYGYGVATDVPVGSSGGASVMTGLTSTTEMAAGDYYIRLYPYYNGSNTFRISNDVILKGTTAAATPSCTAPNHVDISGNWDYFGGETISLSAQAYSSAGTGSPIAEGSIIGYQWKHNGVNIAGATSKTFTKSNCTVSDAGDYSCVVSTGATCSTESSLYGTKVYVLQQYIGGETTYNFTRTGSSQAGTVEVTLPASTQREFKIYAGSTASTTYYMGNNGTIDEDASNWDFEGGKNNVKLNPGLGGTFIFSIDYSANGGAPKVSVTYPRKTVYLTPGVWANGDGEKYAFYYFRDGGTTAWTDFLTNNDCGMSAEIPQWNGITIIPVRLKNTTVAPGNWSDVWNQTNNITVNSNNSVVITGWDGGDGKSTYTYGTYAIPTYTISYAKGGTTATGGAAISGSKADESKTCGVAFTLPSSAVFTSTGYTQTGWTTSDGGSKEYELGGTYTTNAAQTFYPVWEATASLTALECNTLYTPADMLPSGKTISSGWQYDAYGLSGNNKFFIVGNGGDQSTAEADAGIVEIKTGSAVTISGTEYSNYCYFKKAPQMSSTTPTSKAIKFILSGSGSLDVYGKGVLALVKEGGSPTTKDCTSTPSKVTWDNLTAGTYYLYATGTSRYMVAMQFNCCTTPAVPTGFANTAVTSTTATFSITDAGDAASYEIYTSTSSSTPTSETGTSVNSKTPTITGLTANTTYYAWVRAVCDASHKSNWVALTGSSFETEADDGCDMKYWFRQKTDAPAAVQTAGKEQDSFFSDTPSGSSGGSSWSANWTIDEIAYSVTKRAGNGTKICTFTVPTGKTATLYILGQGGSGVTLSLKKSGSSTELSGAAFAANPTKITIENLSSGTYTAKTSGNVGLAMVIVKLCEALTPCTTPVIPTLSNQTVCPGSDIAAWDATQTASLETGESASYSWKKKGSETVLGTSATLDLGSSATESQSGTYVVTVTVSADGKASKSASKEVTLTVTAAVEEPSISSNKATVYAGNSVTLTATCGTAGVTWNWYKCTAADGSGAGSSLATTAAYTFPAPEVGTHYYKATASTSGTCASSASAVYTLTVSEASGTCNMMTIFDGSTMSSAPASTSGSEATSGAAWTAVGTATEMSGTVSMEYSGKTYTKGWKFVGSASGSSNRYIQIVIPEGYTGDLVMNGFIGSTGRSVFVHTSPTGSLQTGIAYWTPATTNTLYTATTRLSAGTYYICATNAAYLTELSVNVCGTESCTDEKPTATATNNTVCSGTALTITATGYESDPTFIQWQKKNGESWDNISGATAATYTVAEATAADAGTYRVQVTKGCTRNSNEVTIAVPSAPVFGAVPSSVTVMQTIALSISTVEASDAVSYKWYKSADATWDAGDTEIGTNKELIKAYDGEAIGSPSYYIFCRAQNACGITTSTAIKVNVTAYVEEDCATKGNESDAEFGFTKESGVGDGSVSSQSCWTSGGKAKYLTYTAPDGKYFDKAKVTVAVSSDSKAAYGYSTDGSSYTYANLTGLSSALAEKTIDLPANVTHFRIGRNFDPSYGVTSGTFYLRQVCFEYADACTATTVTPSETSSVNYEMGGAWSNPTFTLSVAGTLTYSSSNEDIASVDDDGTVTFNGEAGTVTITASYAGNATYCASEGSYTINVSCPGGAPKVVADGSTVGCSSSITLQAKQSDGTSDFADGTYQWFRNGEEIDGATSSSYTATQAGTYTVERTNTSDCTTPSTNSAIVTSETTEPEVERLVPFQYYHVNKTYSDQMKMRHLFAVKNSGKLDGKSFKMYVSRNSGAATDVTSSNALVVKSSGDGHVDTVKVDLNKLSGKYTKGDELVFTCKAIDCSSKISDVYKNTITMNVIDDTPTLALICSGTNKSAGTRKTSELTVGGDFLTGYNKADLCQQTGNTTFDANTEWGLYTRLKENYIVTPVNGYAVFNKLNYEPFDILLLTDYPKASKSDAAKDVLDDMADLCDYRPMLSFKTHMVAKSPSKWAAKGFTTSATENKADGKLNLNIVCYAHPMFESIKEGENVYDDVANSSAPLVYTMLTDVGHEGKKGMQGFELAAAENFMTIGLTHYNATIAKNSPSAGQVTWTPGSEDRMLVTVAERQTNIEARFILFSLNCGAQSMLTEKGRTVVLKCLEYLLETDPLKVADCSFTFDNGEGNERTPEQQAINCPTCPSAGDGKWSNPANWGPDYRLLPGEFTSVRIKKPVEVDMEHAHVMEVRIIDEGSIDIPAGKALDVKSTIRRQDGTEIYPTDVNDIHIGSSASGNGTLIFNNSTEDTKARVDMYSTAKADAGLSADASTWQYIGTPHTDVANARSNYYDSWLYQYDTGLQGWTVIPNGGPLVPFRGYCVTHPAAPVVYDMSGTLVATTLADIDVPANKYVVAANSWVAPIDINAITDDDMEGITEKTIYFFNTGTDVEGDNGTGTEAGTYRAAPIHSASYTGDWQIPSMQGFYITTTSAGTLHLDYDRHVRPTGSRSVVSNRMYAPRHAAAESDEPNVLKIFARGSRYQDKLVVLEREDFTRGYDSGWDGEAWGGGTLSPMVYVTGEGREDAVSAIPEFEGTVIAFKAGEDNEYTIDFEYNSEEPLYLLDTENNTYTQIMTGNAYYFTTSDKSKHARFILTRKSPQIATGVGNVSGDEVQGTKAKKLLIEDKMFIMVNGVLYDATGKIVK